MNPAETKTNQTYDNLATLRGYLVVKSNDLVQKSRFKLSLQEQKIILYLISKIRPEDMDLKEHILEIRDFCKVCGLDANNGANYKYIKKVLKDLRDRSIWVSLADGSETTLAWINIVTMNAKSGAVKIQLDERMKPYLLQLQHNLTCYELLYILAMRSRYSIRLYEILKSYEYRHREVFEMGNLKRLLAAENYIRYNDFKRNVLEIAIKEINALSDLNVRYEVLKDGRRYSKIKFFMHEKKDIDERLRAWREIEESLKSTQMSLFDHQMRFKEQ